MEVLQRYVPGEPYETLPNLNPSPSPSPSPNPDMLQTHSAGWVFSELREKVRVRVRVS